MGRLFDYQNPIWRFMGRIADVFFLTIIWGLCCIPVITIGASTTALYYVTLKMAKNQESYLWKSFWHSFKDNLKNATGIWCIMLAAGIILGSGYGILLRMQEQTAAISFWGLTILVAVYLLVLTLVFPLTARLDAGIGGLFCMAFVTAVKNFSWVLLMAVVTLCIAAIGIFVFWPLLFFGAGAVAYLHSLILVYVIFPKYNWNTSL